MLIYVEMATGSDFSLCNSLHDTSGLFPYWFENFDIWCNPIWHRAIFSVGLVSLWLYLLPLFIIRMIRRDKVLRLDQHRNTGITHVFVPRPVPHAKTDTIIAGVLGVVVGVFYLFIYSPAGDLRSSCELAVQAPNLLFLRPGDSGFGCEPVFPSLQFGVLAIGIILFLPTFSAVRLVRRIVGVAQRLLPG
ncbi:MAG: hypothetical protein H6843_16340 [Rhodospirillaceae bacterium]|nr:hypothetical protein [Rhodospirillaceae bacterium]